MTKISNTMNGKCDAEMALVYGCTPNFSNSRLYTYKNILQYFEHAGWETGKASNCKKLLPQQFKKFPFRDWVNME